MICCCYLFQERFSLRVTSQPTEGRLIPWQHGVRIITSLSTSARLRRWLWTLGGSRRWSMHPNTATTTSGKGQLLQVPGGEHQQWSHLVCPFFCHVPDCFPSPITTSKETILLFLHYINKLNCSQWFISLGQWRNHSYDEEVNIKPSQYQANIKSNIKSNLSEIGWEM